MKLNKKGWGLTNEIIFISIFVICLIIAFVGIYRLGFLGFGKNEDKPNDTFSYEALEKKLQNGTRDYIKDEYNNELGLDTLIITANLLRTKGYLNNYVDENDKYCSGYCEVYLSEDDTIVFEPYVKCGSNYESKGYVSRKDFNE